MDWTGNKNSVFKTLGASNHTTKARHAEDYYATDPKAIDLLLELDFFNPQIWEPACGEGHMSKQLEKYGYSVKSSDLCDRGYGERIDFLFMNNVEWNGDIITNPPYSVAQEFIETALGVVRENAKVAMFLKLQFMEGKSRKRLFIEHPPKTIYVSSSRLLCAKNGEFQKMRDGGGSAVAYAWYVWVKGYKGETVVKWFN